MSNVCFDCLALIHYIKASRRLRRGFAECRVAYAEKVPTQRLRGPTRTGRQPAGAFAVKMHSKKKRCSNEHRRGEVSELFQDSEPWVLRIVLLHTCSIMLQVCLKTRISMDFCQFFGRLKSHGSTKPARPFGLGLWSLCGSLKHLFLVPNWLTTSLLDSGIFDPACAELLSNYNSQEWYFAGLPINAGQSLMATLSDAWHEASGHCEICKTSGSLRTNIVGRQGPSATQLLKKKKKWDLCIMQGSWLLCQMHLAVTKG